jgi:hypothetical protein
MNRIKRHYPGFVDPPEVIEEVDFETTEELLAIEWVARWKTLHGAKFVQYSTTPIGEGYRSFLMAEVIDELNGKRMKWVLGYLKDGSTLDLPIYETSNA